MATISPRDHYINPRKSWEMGTGEPELFETVLSTISGESNVSEIFNYFSIIYPLGAKIPRYITKRLAGSYGTARQKRMELECLSKHGIIRKETHELITIPLNFNNWPCSIGGEALLTNLPIDKSISDIILSIENCITLRNTHRSLNSIPTHVIIKGRLIYDEFMMILQILRAKLIMINEI